ncbi:MAG TPA: hypothetical protein VFN18_10770 [Solirubrobacterales bacterium]|nr:hypothetical protein [Solirubrobacterales bacterium]
MSPQVPKSTEDPKAEERAREEALVEAFRARCDEHDIPVQIDKQPFGIFVEIQMPAGRETRPVFASGRRIVQLLSFPFESYVFLGQLKAIANYGDDFVESYIDRAGGPPAALAHLAQQFDIELNEERTQLLHVAHNGVEVSIGAPSLELKALAGGGAVPSREVAAIRISGLGVATHDSALRALEGIANSLFFEIDATLGTPLVLSRPRNRQIGRRRRREGGLDEISFPTSEYEPEPIALFSYARGAAGMPLLQFLAFYQVLEFYFPLYADQEMRRRIKSVVKHPQFNPHREAQISSIIKAMSVGRGRGSGDERAQLRATLRGSINPDSIREHLRVGGRVKHFGQKKNGPARQPIRIDMSDDDLLDATAARIYELRCKIVHTKDSDAEESQILPFSPEADQLGPDIALLEELARGSLVAANRELRLAR